MCTRVPCGSPGETARVCGSLCRNWGVTETPWVVTVSACVGDILRAMPHRVWGPVIPMQPGIYLEDLAKDTSKLGVVVHTF